jgi:predicted helicase
VGNKTAGAGGTYVGPLYLYNPSATKHAPQPTLGGVFAKRHANLDPGFTAKIAKLINLEYVDDGRGNLKSTFGPEDVFDYMYSVFYAPSFRERYTEFLKTDVPRVPLTSRKQLFASLVKKGQELTALHMMNSDTLDKFLTDFPEKGTNQVEKANYSEPTHRVWINAIQYFGGVPSLVWDFQIGGYRVAEKWLRDRKGRKLTYDDVQHWQRIVVAIKETMRLGKEIDALIPGWPLP